MQNNELIFADFCKMLGGGFDFCNYLLLFSKRWEGYFAYITEFIKGDRAACCPIFLDKLVYSE